MKYGTNNTTETETNGFYVFMFTSEAYALYDNTTVNGKVITDGELVVKAQYLCSMQEITNCYWNQHTQNKVITVPTCTMIYPRLDVTAITYIHDITKSVCSSIQEKNHINTSSLYG